MSQISYGGDPQINEQDAEYLSIAPAINYNKRWGHSDEFNQALRINGFAVLPMSQNVDTGFAIPELYYQISPEPGFLAFSVGRKKENWSELDSHWNLGLWQPLVRWDAASPVEQGLTGLFIDITKTKDFHAVVMVSGVFLPDQQPAYDEVDGRIISSNRWFRAPVSSASLQSNSANMVKYEVLEPEAKDVINQASYAALAEFGDAAAGLFFKGSLTDKPANQFHLGINIEGILNLKDVDYNAQIHPLLVRHKIYSLESGYTWEYSRLVLSTNWESYEAPDMPEAWEQTALMDSRYDGVILSQSLEPLGFKRSRVGFSYVHHYLSKEPARSKLIKGDIEASTQRFAFDEIAGIEFDTNIIRSFKHELNAQLKYIYSIADQGEWVQAGLQLNYSRQWIWGLSGDIFGVPDDTLPSTSFISKYRGNDRISGSLTYVF